MSHGPLTTALGDLLARIDLDPEHPARGVLERLDGPVRIAVSGRIKSGKSTLVNALLHQRVAPTDVGECTKIVTWFRYGPTEQAVIHTLDGRVLPLALTADRALPADPGIAWTEVDRIEVRLSLDVLRSVELVDTPGLDSASDEAEAATRDTLGIDARSRRAARTADALLLVAPAGVASGETQLAEHFERRFGALSGSALSALAVVTRLDELVDGAPPLDGSAGVVAGVADALGQAVADVVPTVGLWAQAATCGLLREDDVRALRSLAAAAPPEQLRSVGRVVAAASAAGLGEETALRLLDLLGLHGVRLVTQEITDRTTAATLRDHLAEWSGVATLETSVREHFARRADPVRVAWALGVLEGLTTEDRRLRDVIEAVELDPRFAPVELARSLGALSDAGALADQLPELRQLVADEDTDALPGPTEGAAAWRARAAAPLADASVRRVALAAARCHDARWQRDQRAR